LDQEQCELVRVTFAKIARNPDMAAAMFYARVFTTNPALRPLFKIDMIEQGKKLMDTLTAFIDNLHHFEQIRPAVRDLGRRQGRRLRHLGSRTVVDHRESARRGFHAGCRRRLDGMLSDARGGDEGHRPVGQIG
jgi:Globin